MYLLHTPVVSELRSKEPNHNVLNRLRAVDPELIYLSAVTIGEIQSGIEITRDTDEEAAEGMEVWLRKIIDTHQVISLDAAIMRVWARLLHRNWDLPMIDAMIAATAVAQRLIVVTDEPALFKTLGVETLNPY